jgi:hypothetical protein
MSGISQLYSVVCSFPLLETFFLELVAFATLLYVSTALNEMRIDLAGSCFDAAIVRRAKGYAVDLLEQLIPAR